MRPSNTNRPRHRSKASGMSHSPWAREHPFLPARERTVPPIGQAKRQSRDLPGLGRRRSSERARGLKPLEEEDFASVAKAG
jgi:hypothetical protein